MMLVLRAELRRFAKSVKAAPVSQAPVLIFLYVFFWLITMSVQALQPGQEQMPLIIVHTMLGYIIWFFSIAAVGAIPQLIFQEVGWGTYEHLHLSAVGIKAILIARSLINTIQNLLMIFAFTTMVGLIHRVVIFENVLGSLLVLVLTIPGLYGFAYILAALVLMFKNMGSWLGLLNFLMIIPVILPPGVMPELLSQVFRFWPVYQAAYVLRTMNLADPSAWLGQGLVELVIGSASFLIIGLLVFEVAEATAKSRGTLGLY